MLILIDVDLHVRLLQCNALHEILVVTPHHRRHLPKVRAALDGISRGWEINSVEIDQNWMRSTAGKGKARSWFKEFGELIAGMWSSDLVNEMDGYVRIPVRWSIDASAIMPSEAGQTRPERHRVRIRDTGHEFTCLEETSVLNGGVFSGHASLPSGCHGGGCGVCKVRVIDGRYRCGRMSCQHVTEADKAVGVVLACRLYPLSDLVVELVGKAAVRARKLVAVSPESRGGNAWAS